MRVYEAVALAVKGKLYGKPSLVTNHVEESRGDGFGLYVDDLALQFGSHKHSKVQSIHGAALQQAEGRAQHRLRTAKHK